MSETLDKDIDLQGEQKKESKVVKTALQMLQDFEPQRLTKDAAIARAKDLYELPVTGQESTRKNKMPSYILNQIIEIYNTYVKIPDVQVKAYGTQVETLTVMSKYLEKVVRDGGFHSIMTQKFGGYRQQSLYGDFFVQMGYDTREERLGMPIYRGVGAGAIATIPTVDFISAYEEGNKATRFGILISYSRGELEVNFPGAIEKAKPGDIPTVSEWSDNTSQKDDLQKSDQKNYYQVLYFYDTLRKVFSIIIGANAYEYKTLKGDLYPFNVKTGGVNKEIIPVAHIGLYPSVSGFYHKGVGETFQNLADIMTQLDSGVVNNAIDNRNAPAILNIENADAGDIMQQLKMAKYRKEKTGDNTYVIPQASVDATGRIVERIGRNSIDYLKNETNYDEALSIKQRFDEEVRRFGFNLDSFFNQQDTARQSELDLQAQTQTISKFQDQNTDAYRLIYDFALDAIIKNGDENSEKPFGSDIEIEDKKVGDILGGSIITEGEVVKMFKKLKDFVEIEINTKSGVSHNPLLERRTLERLLEFTAENSPERTHYLNALSMLEGQSIPKQNQMQSEAIQWQISTPQGQSSLKNTI